MFWPPFRRLSCLFSTCFLAVVCQVYAQSPGMQLPGRIPQTDATDPRLFSTQMQQYPPGNGSFPANTGAPALPNYPTNPAPNMPYSGGSMPYDAYGSGAPMMPNQPYPGYPPTGNPAITRPPPSFLGNNPAPGPYPPASPYGNPAPYGAPYGSAPGFGGANTPYYTPSGPDSLYPNGFGSMPNWNVPAAGDFQRLLQRVRMSHAWVAGGDGSRDLGINSTEVSATFDIPLFNMPDHFLVTPGFGLHLWDGPIHNADTGFADLPSSTYDAYLDVGWNPKITNWLSAETGVRVGVYTDFDTFSTDSIRIMGRGLGVINLSPQLQLKLGVLYIDRNDIKLLPAGGVVWDSPDGNRHWEIFFPRPKLAQRLSTVNNHNMWLYFAGEYGGGAWSIVRQPNPNEFTDNFDYNDLRALVGLEWIPVAKDGPSGFIEVGYVFKRELVYVSLLPDRLNLPDTFVIRGGFSF
jgi:hypothetical protein